MARRLSSYVYVTDADGVSHGFGPDDDVPAWARKAIDNPKAWAGDDDGEPVAAVSTPQGDAAAAAEMPPRGGPGSGRDEWAAYAAALGVEVEGTMTRDDIIEAVEAAG